MEGPPLGYTDGETKGNDDSGELGRLDGYTVGSGLGTLDGITDG